MWLVVGLGNPGREYAETRHNAGFLLVKRAARAWGIRLRGRKFFAKMGEGERQGKRILLALPQTYMNRSGYAVKSILDARKIEPEKMVVAYDDLDIPLGEVRIRKEGGPGTHKGMRSVVEELVTTQFPRIRLGIGPFEERGEATSFVLSRFSREERAIFEASLEAAQQALEMILDGEIEKAMNLFNQKPKEDRAPEKGKKSQDSSA